MVTRPSRCSSPCFQCKFISNKKWNIFWSLQATRIWSKTTNCLVCKRKASNWWWDTDFTSRPWARPRKPPRNLPLWWRNVAVSCRNNSGKRRSLPFVSLDQLLMQKKKKKKKIGSAVSKHHQNDFAQRPPGRVVHMTWSTHGSWGPGREKEREREGRGSPGQLGGKDSCATAQSRPAFGLAQPKKQTFVPTIGNLSVMGDRHITGRFPPWPLSRLHEGQLHRNGLVCRHCFSDDAGRCGKNVELSAQVLRSGCVWFHVDVSPARVCKFS